MVIKFFLHRYSLKKKFPVINNTLKLFRYFICNVKKKNNEYDDKIESEIATLFSKQTVKKMN